MVLFFPAWPVAAAAGSPEPAELPPALAQDLSALIPTDTGPKATPKQQDQALKRLATTIHAHPDPLLHAWAAHHVVPWLTAALVDPRNGPSAAARPAVLHALHVLSTGTPNELGNAVLTNLAGSLQDWLPSLDLADQYAVVQSLFRFPVPTQATLACIPALLCAAHRAVVGEHGMAVGAFDRVLALKLVVLLVPKLPSAKDLPLGLVLHCCTLLTCSSSSSITDPDAARLAAVVVIQSILSHPTTASTAVALPLPATPSSPEDLALAWSLSLPAGTPRALALRALVASSRTPSPSLVAATTLALLALLTHAGAAAGTTCILAVLDALQIIATHLPPPPAVPEAGSGGAGAGAVLDAMWTYLDDPMDSIQSRARAVVEPLLRKLNEPPTELVARVCAATLPQSKVRYVVLAAIVPVVGPLAAWCACFGEGGAQAGDVLESVGRHGMAGRVADFVTAVVTAMKKQPRAAIDQEDERDWWIKSVAEFSVRGLTSPKDLVRKHFVSHLLKPLLANVPELYPTLTKELHGLPGDWLAAHVAVERVARTLDLTPKPDSPTVLVPLAAATHLQATLRLDALGLLADVRRPTQPLSAGDLAWLTRFLTFNLDSADPEFRDGLLTRMVKVLERMRHSGYALGRTAKGRPGAPPTGDSLAARALIDAYAAFLAWLQTLLGAHLNRPGCPYPVAVTCLGLVDALIGAFGIETVPMPHGFHRDHCAVPTFPIAVRIDSERMCRAVVRVVTGAAYEDVQRMAHALAAKFRIPPFMMPELVRMAKDKVQSPRGSEANAGALLWDLAGRCGVRYSVGIGGEKLQGDGEQADAVFIDSLLSTVKHETDLVQHNLLSSAQSSPLPGTLLALQVILSHIDRPERWINELAAVCKQATAAVLDVLTEDAPEGNLPEHMRAGDDGDMDVAVGGSDPDASAATAAASSTSQLILSFSWRVVKHACDLVGVVAERVDAKANASLLAELGSHFISLMLAIRHRGAFCAVQPNLVRITDTLSKSVGSQDLDGWMHAALTAVAQSNYSVTRRSGGLPHVILALVTSPHARYFLPTTMSTLFRLAHDPSASVKVNAMNTLRRLLDDRQLARDTPAWIEPGVLVALEHLHHGDWAVRNGALMLHSSLLTRVFGSRASAGHGERTSGLTAREFFSRYPKLHAALVKHLEAAVTAPEGEIVGGARAFPLLVVLARMAPSPATTSTSTASSVGESKGKEEGGGSSVLSAFDTLVRRCLASPVWKVREVAAEAMVALAERETLVGRVVEAVGQLVNPPPEVRLGQNHVHGSILYVRSLVSAALAVVGQEAIGNSEAKNAVMRLVDHARQSRASPYVQALAVQVATMVVGHRLAPVATEWYRQGIPSGYGSELVKSRLADAMLLGSDSSVLETLLVQEQDPLIHSLVLETLADSTTGALARLLPLSARVTASLLAPAASRIGLRTKTLVDAGHNLPTAHLLHLVSDPPAVPLNLRVPLIHSLAKAANGDATVAATYIDVLTQWAQPEESQFVREGCTASLAVGLGHVRDSAGASALARLVWVVTTLLVQDDDDDVREKATCALGDVILDANDRSVPVNCSAMLPRSMRWLVEFARRDESVRQVLEPLWRATLHKYLVPALTGGAEKGDGLFYKEDPNLFKDHLREAVAVAWAMREIGAEVESFRYLVDTSKNIERARLHSADVSTSLITLQYLFGLELTPADSSASTEEVMAIAQQFTLGSL